MGLLVGLFKGRGARRGGGVGGGGTEEQGQDEQVDFGRERVIGKDVDEEEEEEEVNALLGNAFVLIRNLDYCSE